MKVFGMGTLASMASRERYLRFTHAMYGVYSTMEEELDRCSVELPPTPPTLNSNDNASTNTAIAHFWNRHSEILRRADKLKSDILDISPQETLSLSSEYSTATEEYRNALRDAGTKDREDGGGRLLGHAYTRYLADLMGGQVLGTPTRLALGLKEGTPRQYLFEYESDMDRKTYVEKIYKDLNHSGDMVCPLKSDELESIISEARTAFKCNIDVYSEEPMWIESALGLKNIAVGYFRSS